MKRFIIFILILLSVSSCYKVWVDKPILSAGYFSDEVVVCDTLIYNMSCQVYSDSAKMQLLKRAWITTDTYDVYVAKDTLKIKKDTLLLLQEDLNFSSIGFKRMLEDKNKIQRDKWYFMFTPNVGITWYTFDKIFNKYIKEE